MTFPLPILTCTGKHLSENNPNQIVISDFPGINPTVDVITRRNISNTTSPPTLSKNNQNKSSSSKNTFLNFTLCQNFPRHAHSYTPDLKPIERGLNGLSLFPQETKRQDSDRRSVSTLMSPDSFPFRSSSSSTILGDYIGMESCVDVLAHADQLEPSSRAAGSGDEKPSCRRYRRSSSALERANCRREFPPPIPSLAQTENLHSRMPWVLRRHYTVGGRLILTEEKVRHHEYFRTHRSNGRLTLHLVPVDGAVLAASLADNNNETIEKDQCNIDVDDHNDQDMDDGGGDDVNCGEEEEEQCNENDKSTGNHEIGGSGSGGKCFNYSSGHCILAVAVPAIANKACS